ncbi:MAG: TetR/AcrR family transcriptional regulator [Chloroflexi bacterium]|nr:TetR/AcrR family transcriptional regulator [Chloroflexota bacterium]
MVKVVNRENKRPYNTALRRELAQVTRQRIVDAARRLLLNGTYSSVTMDDIASQAGVAYQTVYSVFSTKLRLAEAMIGSGLHVEGVDELIRQARQAPDPEVALRTGARIARRINETCADLVRFMRESGDPDLLKSHHEQQARRLVELGYVPEKLDSSGRLRPSLSAAEVHDVIWAMADAHWYIQLVFERGWTPSRYEQWLGDALINMLLEPNIADRSTRRAG